MKLGIPTCEDIKNFRNSLLNQLTAVKPQGIEDGNLYNVAMKNSKLQTEDFSCQYLHFDKTEDIHLKSGISTQILTLKSSGSNIVLQTTWLP